MLKIRLQRAGRKARPFYKIVLTEHLSRRDGKSIAELGYYDPLEENLKVNKEDLLKYLKNGAYPTARVRHLILKMLNEYNVQS